MEFNLLDEPWLPVLPREGGTVISVSLTDALLHGERYRRLVGASPTMTAALHRLLLALLHRVYGPKTSEEWRELWVSDGGLPEGPLMRYREKWKSRFDLFHDQVPFFQCPQLRERPSSDGQRKPRPTHSTTELVAYQATGSSRTLYDHTTADQRPRLDPTEAARWLVTLQAYDTGGTKTPFKETKKSERGNANRFGCVLVEGWNLHETLLLNAVPYYPADEKPLGTTPADSPVWEQEPPPPEPGTRLPKGWTDVLTWPARRVLLFPTEDTDGRVTVDGVLRMPGVTLEKNLSEYIELMASFRQKWKSKTSLGDRHPVSLEGLRGVWRYTQEMLLPVRARWHVSRQSQKKKPLSFPLMSASEPDRQRPAALENIAEMTGPEGIADDRVLTLRVFGQELDTKGGGGIIAWYEEAVPAPVSLLRTRDNRLGGVIGHAVAYAADLGDALRAMERQYRERFAPARQSGQRNAKSRGDEMPTATEVEYWPRLSGPFADFLRELGSCAGTDAEVSVAGEQWGEYVLSTARRAAQQWAEKEPRGDRMLLAAAACFEEYMTTVWRLRDVYRTGLAGVIKGQEGTA